MAWLYDFFIDAGVSATAASWGVVAVTFLCFVSIFKAVVAVCK